MSREQKIIAAQITRLAAQADVELAAVDGHHVAGSAYHWRHEWHPLDVRTAVMNRKKKAARALHAAGAPHFNPEPTKFEPFGGVKSITGGIEHVHKPKAPERTVIDTPVGQAEVGKMVEFVSSDGTKLSGDVERVNADGSLQVKHHGTGDSHKVERSHITAVESEPAPEPPKAPEPEPEPPKAPEPTPEPPKPAPAPTPPPAPKPEPLSDDEKTALQREKVLKAKLKSLGGVSNLHTVENPDLENLQQMTGFVDTPFAKDLNKRIQLHVGHRFNIETLEANRAARLSKYGPYTPPSKGAMREAEKKLVGKSLAKDAADKKKQEEAFKRAEAKARAAEHPEELEKLQRDLESQYGFNRYNYPSAELEKLVAAGDRDAPYALKVVKAREAKRAKQNKATDDIIRRKDSKTGEGSPVSAALENKTSGETKRGVDHAIAVIDKVHSDGELVPIPVKSSSSKSRYGQYASRGGDGSLDNISISNGGDHHAMTAAHEIGHWLDRRALPTGEGLGFNAFQSNRAAQGRGLGRGDNEAVSPEWADWWKAIESSDGITQLKAQPRSSYKTYTLTPHEIWARSYAQYIAHRSGDPEMMKQKNDIVALRQNSFAATGGYTQWEDADFEPIAKAIDGILKAKGWTK